MAPTRKYNLRKEMYTEGAIYLGDHLTRSWTRDERRNSKQLGSPVISEPGNILSAAGSVYQIKQTHPPISRTRSSLRGSRRNWAAKSALQTVSPEEFQRWKQSFDDLLQSPVGSKLFRIFLESEIAEENLLFWEACEELKEMKKEKRMQKLIQNIFDDFISVYSPREINIDYKMREDIVEQLNNSNAPDPNVFRDAQMQIYHLMHRDSYPRFLASAQVERRQLTLHRREKQRDHCEIKHKANKKSRMLCCYSDDSSEHGAPEHSAEYRHMNVQESPGPTRNAEETNKRTFEKSDSMTKVSELVTTSKESTTSPNDETVVEVAPPSQIEVAQQEASNCGTESSNPQSGMSYCDNEINDVNNAVHVEKNSGNDVTPKSGIAEVTPNCNVIDGCVITTTTYGTGSILDEVTPQNDVTQNTESKVQPVAPHTVQNEDN